jgi:tetratricopeptide (TPR) repeat protein
MAGIKNKYTTVIAASIVIPAATLVLWLYSGSGTFAAGKLMVGLIIGASVAFLSVFVNLTRPVTEALVAPAKRDYLVPGELPPPPPYFVGRDNELTTLTAALTDPAHRNRHWLVLLFGEPGVGKSGFALKAAASVAARFTDGVVYVSMTDAVSGSDRLHNVLGDLIDSLHGPGDTVPADTKDRLAEFRRLSSAKKRVLYVLDDVPDPSVLEMLRPLSSQAVVLVTSRHFGPLDSAWSMRVEPLSTEDSIRLLLRLLRLQGPQPVETAAPEFASIYKSAFAIETPAADASERDDWANADAVTDGTEAADEETLAAVRRVAVTAAGYPLALHLAVRAIMTQGVSALPQLTRHLPGEGSTVDVEAARSQMLLLSVNVLTKLQRQALFTLAWMPPGPFLPWQVRALANLPDEDVAWSVCERLADLRLLERIASDATGVLRLRLPDRVADFIHQRLESGSEAETLAGLDRENALRRLAEEPARRSSPTVATVLAALDRGDVGKAVDEARWALSDAIAGADPLGPTTLLPEGSAARDAVGVLAEVLVELGGLDDAMEIATSQARLRRERGIKQTPRDGAEIRIQRIIGRLQRRAGRLDAAIGPLATAFALAKEHGDADQQIQALRERAIVESAQPRGFRTARQTLRKAQALLDEVTADRRVYLQCRLVEAGVIVLLNTDDDGVGADGFDGAVHDIDHAITLLTDDFRLWRAWLRFQRARVLLRLGDLARDEKEPRPAPDGEIVSPADRARRLWVEARRSAERALTEFALMVNRYGTARCRLEIGRTYVREGRHAAALQPLEEARETFFFCGDRLVEADVAVLLAEVRAHIEKFDHVQDELDFAQRVFRGVNDRRGLARVRHVRSLAARQRRAHRRPSPYPRESVQGAR